MTTAFHLRGRHVQHAHGKKSADLADGEHLGCGMIALMPTAADAKRLKLAGGETAEDLHVTLFFLGCDMDVFSQEDRVSLTNRVMDAVSSEGPVSLTGRAFGVNHWNGDEDKSSWVLGIGDLPAEDRGDDGVTLEYVRSLVVSALEDGHSDPELPLQHTPWAPHICLAYTKDLSLARELQKRLGPVEFDRVRVAFAGEYTDIPLSGSLTAAAGPMRRNPTPVELAAHTDFSRMQTDWEDTVNAALKDLGPSREQQIAQITAQVRQAALADDLDALDTLTVDEESAYRALYPHLVEAARTAAEAQQKEAEDQGVTVPEWSLSGSPDAVTAAVGRDLLAAVSRATARLMSGSLIQSAVSRALTLFGRGNTPELVTQGVETHLNSLTEAGPRESVGGAVTQAQNEGRRIVLSVAPPGRYFASEALDRNSCKPCRDVDGTEYSTLALSAVAYPSGGYRNCLGGSRCRGTIVTVWSAPGETASGAVTAAEGTDMPYHVEQDHPDCESGQPYAVVKNDSSEVMGCHGTREEAQAQVDALYASEEDRPAESMDYAASTAPWRGPLAVEGIVTGDGREFAEGSLTWADLPVPLRWNKEDSHGGEPHTVAVNVGRIDKIWRDGSQIMGEGVLNLAEPDGQRAYDLIKGKFLRGVSIDADSISDADVEVVWPEGDGDDETDDDPFAMLFGGPPPEKVIFHAGRVRAATLVDIPAFAEAYVALVGEDGEVVAGGQPYTEDEYVQAHPVRASVTAAAVAVPVSVPPAEWFTDPKLSGYTGVVVTDDGRLYGHVAPWNACHIGYDGQCVTAPREDAHDHYMTGEVICSDGSRAAVGQITIGTGHASLYEGAKPAAEHYDNTGTAVADVAVGNDRHGIWVAGAIRPGADPQAVFDIRAAGRVSGDWRRIGGKLRLVALLGVNTAGFLQGDTRTRARVAGGQPMALVAAGVTPPVWRPEEMTVQRAYRVILDELHGRVHERG